MFATLPINQNSNAGHDIQQIEDATSNAVRRSLPRYDTRLWLRPDLWSRKVVSGVTLLKVTQDCIYERVQPGAHQQLAFCAAAPEGLTISPRGCERLPAVMRRCRDQFVEAEALLGNHGGTPRTRVNRSAIYIYCKLGVVDIRHGDTHAAKLRLSILLDDGWWDGAAAPLSHIGCHGHPKRSRKRCLGITMLLPKRSTHRKYAKAQPQKQYAWLATEHGDSHGTWPRSCHA
jgi:hypothetical protein